jgi:hypothetical protein
VHTPPTTRISAAKRISNAIRRSTSIAVHRAVIGRGLVMSSAASPMVTHVAAAITSAACFICHLGRAFRADELSAVMVGRRWLWIAGVLGFAWFFLIPALVPFPNPWWAVVGMGLTTGVLCTVKPLAAVRLAIAVAGGVTAALLVDLATRGSVLAALGDETDWFRYLLLEWATSVVGVALGGLIGGWVGRRFTSGRELPQP